MSTDPRFIHLRLHSEHSLLEGAIPVKKLFEGGLNPRDKTGQSRLPSMVEAAGMPAVALTDSNNMFAALEFSEAAAKAGVQPIVGCQISLAYLAVEPGKAAPAPASIVLLAQNEAGYQNLMKLNSCLYLPEDNVPAQVSMDDLRQYGDGLICLSGGPTGPAGRLFAAEQDPAAIAHLGLLHEIFSDRFYIELQRHPGEGGLPEATRLAERGGLNFAYEHNVPIVATNDVHFPKTDLYEAHDALLCIADGAYVDQQQPRRRLTPQHYFKSQEEMVTLFADLPEAIENTVEIAKRCAVRSHKRDPILPKFADDEIVELRRQAEEGLKARLAVIPLVGPVSDYEERLDFELKIIEGMGFPGYFLIVADFIHWAKDRGIPVGPGRGSGAGSLVAYALTITDLDPLRYSLLFERFLNPERVSMPDFDIDFCMDRREEVITYVQEKYGADKVAQIITFGALLSKAAVRDVGRVLQMSYGQVDRLSKLIPVVGVKPMSIAEALVEEPRLREEAKAEEVVDRLLTYAQQLEGLYRNASTHAAGVVIGDRPIDELVPLYRDPRSTMPATQFNMKWVEQAGLVKFDFLGLKTLTVIQNAVEQIQASGRDLHVDAEGTKLFEPPVGLVNDIATIPLDDEKSYELYASAKTIAVFQVESSGMMDALKRMKPTTIEDIVALVALYRPGPMENIPKYCEVKNGLSERDRLHPLVDHLLDETQGIIVYQEQVMQIAQEMAGYSLGGADMLRRAMGKKIQAAMDAERPKFMKGSADNGVDAAKATEVWNLLDKFANYGFNKSHAAAYAVVSYQTAWLKANHPVEFMAGVMNCDIHLTDKLGVYFQEVKKGLGLGYTPPCVNRSDAAFKVHEGALVYALGALKNVGSEAMRLIEVARENGQPFVTLFDFARRVDMRKIGKRPLEMLARAGAFDILDPNRHRVFGALDALGAYSAAIHEQRNSAQESLFGDAGDDLPEPRLPNVQDWLPAERLAEEFKAIGFYLSGHPLDDYMAALRRKDVMTLDEITARARNGALIGKIAGTVSARQERKSAKGNRYAFVSLSDPTGQYEVTMFSDVLEASRAILEVGDRVVLQVEATMETDQLKLLARSASAVDPMVAGEGNVGLRIYLGDDGAIAAAAGLLFQAKKDKIPGGRGPISLCITAAGLPGEVEIDCGDGYPVTPQIKGALRSLPGVIEVEEI